MPQGAPKQTKEPRDRKECPHCVPLEITHRRKRTEGLRLLGMKPLLLSPRSCPTSSFQKLEGRHGRRSRFHVSDGTWSKPPLVPVGPLKRAGKLSNLWDKRFHSKQSCKDPVCFLSFSFFNIEI